MTITMLAASGWGKVTFRMEPSRIVAGEPVTLYLVNSEADFPLIEKLPETDNLTWLSNQPQTSMSTKIINGDKSVETISLYNFVVKKPGQLTIPAFVVKAGSKRYNAGPLKLSATGRKFVVNDKDGGATEVEIDDLIMQKVIIDDNRKKFYVGEEIPLEIRIFSSTGLNFQLRTWPQIEVEKVVFRDFSAVNRENRNFAQVRRFTENIGGRDYIVVAFSSAFRAISAGPLTGNVTTEGEVRIREERSRANSMSDPFDAWGFMGSQYRSVPKKLVTALPTLTIVPLPQVPTGAEFIGLMGTWRITPELSSTTAKVGDTLTLKIKLEGVGSLDNLIAPRLNLPGFRVYPPEIDRKYNPEDNRSRGEIRYIMIPTETGEEEIKINFVYFDTEREKYQPVTLAKSIKVEKSDVLTSTENVFVGTAPEQEKPAASSRPPENRSSILYLKRNASGQVELPLYENHFRLLLLLLIAGPALALGVELNYRRRRKLEKDPALRRRLDALARRGKVLKAVSRATDSELETVIRSEVVNYLNDLLGLPPGTAATEQAEKIKDPELGRALREAGESGYMPNAEHLDCSQLRRMTLNGLKRLGMAILAAGLLFSGLPVSGAVKAKETVKINNADAALTAYERGDYQAAAAYYGSLLNAHAPDPAWLYNLGNCLCQQKKYPAALVCYEKAWRLRPSDSDIIENLNFVRRKLFLPEIGQVATPLDWLKVCRDWLRPDQWMVVGGFGWLLLFAAIAARRRLPRGKWLPVVIGAMMLITAIAAIIWQYHGPYLGNEAIVIDSRAAVYQLPSDNADKADFKLRGGQPVTIVDTRSGWIRVRTNNDEGWVKADAIASLWSDWTVRELDRLYRK